MLVYGTLAYLWATGRPVDDRLIDIALIILGFFFKEVVSGTVAKINGLMTGK